MQTVAKAAETSQPDASREKNILLLYSYGHGGKGIGVFDSGLLKVLQGDGGVKTNNLFFEYLDLERNRMDPQYEVRLHDLLQRKYAARPIDVILTVQQPALNWLLNKGRDIAPKAPAVSVQAPMPSPSEAGSRRIVSHLANFDVKGTLERALEIFPGTNRVVVVAGNSEVDQKAASSVEQAAARWNGKLAIEQTNELPMDAMLKRVANLPLHALVLFTQYNRDSSGRVTVAYEVERQVVKAANVPVFGLYDFNLINGGMGGSVVSVKALGEETGQLLLDIVSEKRSLEKSVTRIDVDVVPMFDWSQIKQRGGDTSKLPKNTVFVNKFPTFLEQYGAYALGLAVFTTAQFLMITALLLSRRRRRLAEHSLQISEARYRTLIEHAPDAVVLYDVDTGLFIDCNAAAERLFGCSRTDLLKTNPEQFYPSEQFGNRPTKDVVAESVTKVMAGDEVMLERMVRNVQGAQCVCELRLVRFPEVGRRLVRASFIDITQRKQSEEALRIAAAAFESQLGMTITNAQTEILQVNRAFTEITGYSAQEVIGRTPSVLSSGRHDSGFYASMWSSISHTGAWQGEIWNRRRNGDVYPSWLTITAVKSEKGQVTHYVATIIDITERKTAADEINNLAFYDPLTRLPNRRLLMDRLTQVLASGSRHHRNTALLFVDLDNFKILNDTLGHANGDLLLEQVAHRLSASVREGDTVARLGGDEFVVMLEDLSEDPMEAATQTEAAGIKILSVLGQSYSLTGREHHSTVSIGVTLLGGQHEAIDEPLKRADLAMYQAKAAGRNTLRFFDPQMQAVVSARAALESDLRVAIEKSQFFLVYQAQVSDKTVMGVEALVRWRHPLRGVVSPASFIPLAEETGLILNLGSWVLRTACHQLATWANAAICADMTIAVNVSPRQFHQVDFVDQVLNVLHETGANPNRLKLELTEGLLVDDIEGVISKMRALKEVGVGFSLDDFGTGYSSLAYLKRLPLDQLKIDQGFVRDILVDVNDAAIARMVIVLAQSLGLAVIAEGVETAEQRNFLAEQGCHAYQGYLFSRPLPIEEFQQLSSVISAV